MSLDRIEDLLTRLPDLTDVTLKLIHYDEDAEAGMCYQYRPIELHPEDLLRELLGDIKKEYVDPGKRLSKYQAVEIYDGSTDSTKIYSLDSNNPLIHVSYENLCAQVAHLDAETNVFKFGANAYSLSGYLIQADGPEAYCQLITVQTPFKLLRHKYLYENGVFCASDSKVLELRLYADIIIIDSTVYFMNTMGEKFFGMERSYHIQSQKLVEQFAQVPFLLNVDADDGLASVAQRGHYPRMLVSYQASKMNYLKKPENRQRAADKFGIHLTADGSIDVGTEQSARSLIRFLCNRGMLDLENDSAVEVSSAKRWVP